MRTPNRMLITPMVIAATVQAVCGERASLTQAVRWKIQRSPHFNGLGC